MSRWDATGLGTGEWRPEPLSLGPEVEKALAELTEEIPLYKGLVCQEDRATAKKCFASLKQQGLWAEPEQILTWAVRNGWAIEYAKELKTLAERYL